MDNSVQIKNRIKISSRSKQMMLEFIAYAFIFLFLYTAYDKAMNHSTFVKSLERYEILKEYANVLAWLIPASEIAVACLLLFPKTRKLGMYGALCLMLIFTAGLFFIVYTLETHFCGCGGVLNSLSAVEHLWFNAVFIILALLGILLYKKESLN